MLLGDSFQESEECGIDLMGALLLRPMATSRKQDGSLKERNILG
jgi:hypothetical protein